ncbi:CAP-associated domain-containing protein [Sporosarcina thermotolerans]|uniref:CAP-associated domain-containing protein n=1 Tax=Sporosarcina thermotolerans TaxID=633404 RepID=A0AAW9AEB8_9BACL|nr:CAP-associated domain-containing protein [Sporosarcina thermotolerans]MDW0117958.1 CAP-associated domain-containing protein [Sporosarcina thermotolerans]WHT49039.1 CAP-associated domain-containing protein [Sporosarcina thermotolerans]
MRRILLFIIFIVAFYLAKPLWEEPVSKYIDLSFLSPVDEKIETVMENESITSAMSSILDTANKFFFFISSKSSEMERLIPDKVAKPKLATPDHSAMSIHNIELGFTEEQVKAELGEPQNHSLNEYGTEWFTYHEDYQNFVMISFDEKWKVNAIYTNDDLISSKAGIQYGTGKAEVRNAYGEPLKEIRKGLNIYVLQDNEGMDLFKVGDVYMYVFYDIHQNTTVTAVQLITTSLEHRKSGMYAGGDVSLRNGFEQQLFDLTNAARVRHGRSILRWDNAISDTARKHSLDMAINDYFSHDNLKGQSPFDRMKEDQIKFRRAGENLAYGQSSSIFAHEGLMNSKGHRENILIDDYSHLGIGVAFNEKSQPYYTENFFLK